MAEIKQQAAGSTAVKQYGKIDLVICLDTTGSMSAVIEAVKDNIAVKLIGEMKNQMAKNQCPLDWRARIIGFGRLPKDAVYQGDFTSDEKKIVSELQNIPRTSGAGGDESSFDALYVAAQSPWRDMPVHKVVVLFTDESPEDLDASTVASGPRDVGRIIEEYTQNRIKLFVYGPRDEKFEKLTAIPKASVMLFDFSEIDKKLPGMDFSKEFGVMATTMSTGAMDLANMTGLPSKSM